MYSDYRSKPKKSTVRKFTVAVLMALLRCEGSRKLSGAS